MSLKQIMLGVIIAGAFTGNGQAVSPAVKVATATLLAAFPGILVYNIWQDDQAMGEASKLNTEAHRLMENHEHMSRAALVQDLMENAAKRINIERQSANRWLLASAFLGGLGFVGVLYATFLK